MNVFIIPHYVPSKLNLADVWSRQQIRLTEASLDPRSMQIILKKFSWMRSGTDWMASAVNRKCPKFISEYPLKPVRTPVAILGSLGVCIYVPASRHWLISYSPVHLN